MSNAERTVEIDDEDTTPETWGFAQEDPSVIVDANHLPVGRAAHPGSLDAHKLAAAGEMFDLITILALGSSPEFDAAAARASDLIAAVETLNYG